jgi:hypothetical protein
VDNLFTTTALAWNPDGSRLAVGGQTGTLALFDTCLRRCRYKASFELTYVSNSTIVVKALASGSRTVLSSGAWRAVLSGSPGAQASHCHLMRVAARCHVPAPHDPAPHTRLHTHHAQRTATTSQR